MTATHYSGLSARRQEPRSVLVVTAIVITCAVGIAVVVGNWPLLVAGGLAALVVLVFLLRRLDLTVAILTAGFFFNDYLARGAGIITIDKAIGALAVLAWGLDWVVNRRPVMTSRGLWVLCAFVLWVCVSIVAARNDKAALVTTLRYVTFGTLYFLVLQTVRGDRRGAGLLVRVVVTAAAIASVIGLVAFFSHH